MQVPLQTDTTVVVVSIAIEASYTKVEVDIVVQADISTAVLVTDTVQADVDSLISQTPTATIVSMKLVLVLGALFVLKGFLVSVLRLQKDCLWVALHLL